MGAWWAAAIVPFFAAWRLVNILAVSWGRSAHGPDWLMALLSLTAAFGGEYLARRSPRQPSPEDLQRRLGTIVVALILLGAFPEESVVGVILWLGIGVAWGQMSSRWPPPGTSIPRWGRPVAAVAGGLLGAVAMVGPGAWIAAALLLPLWFTLDKE